LSIIDLLVSIATLDPLPMLCLPATLGGGVGGRIGLEQGFWALLNKREEIAVMTNVMETVVIKF